MFRTLAVFSMAIALCACAQDPQGEADSTNGNVPAVKLTEIDGCTVYRFHDAGHYRYLAKCKDAVSATISSQVNCGKSCIRADELQAIRVQ